MARLWWGMWHFLRPLRSQALIGLLLIAVVGCGYELVGVEPTVARQSIALAVVPFTNQTREANLEQRTTAALRQALVYKRAFVLTSDAMATRRLQGAIRQFRTVPLSFDTNDTVLQYRLEADIRFRLVDTTTQRPMLEQDILAWAEYLVSRTRDVREEVVARDVALARLAQQFADKCMALLQVTLL